MNERRSEVVAATRPANQQKVAGILVALLLSAVLGCGKSATAPPKNEAEAAKVIEALGGKVDRDEQLGVVAASLNSNEITNEGLRALAAFKELRKLNRGIVECCG